LTNAKSLLSIPYHFLRIMLKLSPTVYRTLRPDRGDPREASLRMRLLLNYLDDLSPIPHVSMDNLFGDKYPPGTENVIQCHPACSAGIGSTRWVETVLLSTLIKAVSPEAALEIGTFRGRTTYHLYKNSPPGTRIYTFDLPPQEVPDDITDASLARNKTRDYLPDSDRVINILMNTRKWDGTLPEKVQFVLIDGSHSYDDVKNDTEKAFQCADDKVCFCWHDCTWGDGVPRYLEELRSAGYNIFRVKEELEVCTVAIWMSPQCIKETGLNAP
jgi:hypothetical protein